jgi:hypothetical protein
MLEATHNIIHQVFTDNKFSVLTRYFLIVNGQRAILVASNAIHAIRLQEFRFCLGR